MFESPLFLVAAFLLGACVGSFLNVVIYRIPNGLSINTPRRSFCPSCRKSIAWYHNIPLASWVLLGGKCRYCRKPITIRYWLVELLTAILFLAFWYYFPGLEALFLFAWCALALAVSFIDAEHMEVYPLQTITATIMAVLAIAVNPGLIGELTVKDALIQSGIGIASGFLLIRIIIELGKLVFGKKEYNFDHPVPWHLRDAESDHEEVSLVLDGQKIEWSYLFSRPQDKIILSNATAVIDENDSVSGEIILTATQLSCGDKYFALEKVESVEGTTSKALIPREAMGSGDPYILAMICALTGWQSIPVILLTACLLGILLSLFQRLGFGARIPFGPLLCAGGFFWIFYGYKLWDSYLGHI